MHFLTFWTIKEQTSRNSTVFLLQVGETARKAIWMNSLALIAINDTAAFVGLIMLPTTLDVTLKVI